MIRLFCVCLVLSAAQLAPAMANNTGRQTGDARDQTAGQLPSNRLTHDVVSILTKDFERCIQTDAPYQAECYKWVFRRAWQTIDGNRAYHTAQTALETADRTLAAFVRDNVDWSHPPRLYGAQIYRPITPQANQQTLAVTDAVMADARNSLLEAADQVGDHNARIAAAITADQGLLQSTAVD